MSADRDSIVLLSARPEARKSLMSALTSAGVSVRVARHPDRALELLGQPVRLVLVDLEHSEAMDPRVVATLNERRGDAVVLAVHDGGLRSEDDAIADLAVDGTCRADQGHAIFHARAGRIRTGALIVP